ncbi:MAG: flagellar hook-basal body complex protein [Peptostreptococcaceae bacterium]
MIRGMYTSASAMISLQSRQAVINNNMANINTTGYKSESLITKTFDEVLLSNHDDYKNGVGYRQDLGTLSFGIAIDETVTNNMQGTLYETGNSTDFGIIGDGYFRVVDADENEYFTRDGSFRVNEIGYLTTSTGELVTGTNLQNEEIGPIYVGNEQIVLNSSNELEVANQTYKLNVFSFNNVQELEKVSNNLYVGENSYEVFQSELRQNHLEGSNVDYIDQTTLMMQNLKEFEANQKVIQTMDSTLAKIASEIGRI